jgi:hypothetical protein
MVLQQKDVDATPRKCWGARVAGGASIKGGSATGREWCCTGTLETEQSADSVGAVAAYAETFTAKCRSYICPV